MLKSPPSVNRVHVFAALLVLSAACGGEGASEELSDPVDSVASAVLSGPVAIGPFLDGALPSRTPGSVVDGDWTTTVAFPNLDLGSVSGIAGNAADTRIYAMTLDGLISAFENEPNVSTATTFLDLRDRVATVFEGGLLGLAFHPEFGQPGSPHGRSLYTYYTSHCPIDASRNSPDLSACDDSYPTGPIDGFYDVWIRLSRFEVFDGTLVGDPNSEQVLFNVRLFNSVHRGGDVAVSADGSLYVSIGDQGSPTAAQSIEDFKGTVLRVNVNVADNGDGTWTCPPGTHQPRRRFDTADEISGLYYCVPDDNPWLDGGGSLLEEHCAIGFRNPYRLSLDPVTDRVWVGDVGGTAREEIDVVECGGNYGWPFREGSVSGPNAEPSSYLGVLKEPVVDFTRSEARSIIGGYVYRGTRFPSLTGLYLTGDFVTRRIWAIDYDEASGTGTKTFLTQFTGSNLATWGQTYDGEVWLGTVFSDGRLYTLDRLGMPGPDAPPRLSLTGAFSNLPNATPNDFWVPYGLNQPFWSDGAIKSRYIALPNDGVRDQADEKIEFSEAEEWSYPVGTVIMKHFELPLDETSPSARARLETRFLVHGDDGIWYGITYRWRSNLSDADLLAGADSASYDIALEGGGTRTQVWNFPSRSDCLTCHIVASGSALGPSAHQLNGDFFYEQDGQLENQLAAWSDLGMFDTTLDAPAIATIEASSALGDVTAPLEARARSWLDSNCGYCHRPGGIDAGFDARFTTPYGQQNFAGTPVRDDLGVPGMVVLAPGDPTRSALVARAEAVGPAGMPPLAKELAEDAAVEILDAWITRLPTSPDNVGPIMGVPSDQDGVVGDAISFALTSGDQNLDDVYYDASNLPTGLSVNHETGLITGTLQEPGQWNVAASVSDGPEVASVAFEWLVCSTPGPECDSGNDCRAARGRAPLAPYIALAVLALLAAQRRRAHRG
ncbi:MAG: PQQ-dependent sugar dehydrogenase [Myxococcota bacterium]